MYNGNIKVLIKTQLKPDLHISPGAFQPGRHIPSNISSYSAVFEPHATFYMVIQIIYCWKLFIPGYENHRNNEKKKTKKVLQKLDQETWLCRTHLEDKGR